MKPPNLRSQKTLLTAFLFLALAVSAGAAHSSPQDKPRYTLAEFNAFEAQMRENSPTKKIKLLDGFYRGISQLVADAIRVRILLPNVLFIAGLPPHHRLRGQGAGGRQGRGWIHTSAWPYRGPQKLTRAISAFRPF